MSDLLARDARHAWHPYTQHAVDRERLPVASARDATLVLEDGREVIDAISSWWATLHGHGVPEIAEAIGRQARDLDHVLFAGATHEPATALAEQLVEVTPPGLERVFFSDDGSTAVEVALKMVYQSWVHAGEPQRRVFVALEGGFHGDTFGAMSLGDPDPFFEVFRPLLFDVVRVPPDAARLAAALDELGDRAAGLVIEPLVQGAAGMVMHGEDFVRAARAETSRRGLPLVADEVMTGFGRTGALFACTRAGVSPDMMCLSKGLTGGTVPLAATVTTEPVFEAFLSQERSRALFHGHTFTANPIGCAAALASLELCRSQDVPARLDEAGQRIERSLRSDLEGDDRVRDLRRTGGIVALELEPPPGDRAGYLAALAPRLRAAAVERGVLLRPLGNVLYALPPARTTDEQLDRIAAVMAELVGVAHGD
jgi:adenosylmethionine-8-amino-7-oxononanoate aminotransferase